MKNKELVFSVRAKDCREDRFRAGGNGGQNQNKRDTGVRFTHEPSGAVGESREHRTQLENRRAAWKRMGESDKFQAWARRTAAGLKSIDEIVEEQMAPENIQIEYGPFQ